MSVEVMMRVPADTEVFRNFVEANGAIHHRFAVGDGYVMIIDEWETADAFMGWFMSNEVVEKVMRESGAQGEPEISIGEALESASSSEPAASSGAE